jgi:hypothetical protein
MNFVLRRGAAPLGQTAIARDRRWRLDDDEGSRLVRGLFPIVRGGKHAEQDQEE